MSKQQITMNQKLHKRKLNNKDSEISSNNIKNYVVNY